MHWHLEVAVMTWQERAFWTVAGCLFLGAGLAGLIGRIWRS